MSRTLVRLVLAVPFLLAAARPAAACSMCYCGDPTFMLVGSQIFVPNAWRLSLDGGRYEKDQVGEDDPSSRETEIENRYTVSVTRTLGRRVALVAQVPFSDRTLRDDEGSVSLSGLSNPELLGNFRIATGSGRPGTWLSLTAGVRAPWGRSDGQIAGERAEEHVQPSTGAWGGVAGLSFSRLVGDQGSLFGSVLGRTNGRNEFGYHYGDAVLANLAYERRLVKWLNGVVELNYRWAARDEVAVGEDDPNTGGSVLYVTPRVIAKIQNGVFFRVAVQIPVAQGLYGIQTEKTNVMAGFTTRF